MTRIEREALIKHIRNSVHSCDIEDVEKAINSFDGDIYSHVFDWQSEYKHLAKHYQISLDRISELEKELVKLKIHILTNELSVLEMQQSSLNVLSELISKPIKEEV